MISSLNLLYIVLALAVVALTVLAFAVGFRIMRILDDVQRISQSLEQMTGLVERVAQVVFPGLERVAKRADSMEQKVAGFIEKKINKISKS